MAEILLDGSSLTIDRAAAIAREPGSRVEITDEVRERIVQSRNMLSELLQSGRTIYGVNTGLGGFVNRLIPMSDSNRLQENLIAAVATNVGDYLSDKFVRATMLARLNCLARGTSAISLENFEQLRLLFNAGIIPCIPEKGSLGASGDLGPLAYVALVATGKWRAKYQGAILPGATALERAGLRPMKLDYKEGLALINGTSAMTGVAAVLAADAVSLLKLYDLISCLTLEALRAKVDTFAPQVHRQKPHPGQLATACNIHGILSNSRMIDREQDLDRRLHETHSGSEYESGIEDAYSIRCTPQILGPIKDTLKLIVGFVERELNSSNDNPLLVSGADDVFHTGHFHGQYVAMGMDMLCLCLTTLSNLSDRRTDRLLDRNNSNGLPPFLCLENPGVRLGLMGIQFASTSLTAENRSLCVPVSIQTLPSTQGFQDIVSLGLVAARRATMILNNAYYIAAVELLCACQAADIRGKQLLSPATRVLYEMVRQVVPYLGEDVVLTDYLEALATLLRDPAALPALESANGPLAF
jgi:histidine ammonia-lyase